MSNIFDVVDLANRIKTFPERHRAALDEGQAIIKRIREVGNDQIGKARELFRGKVEAKPENGKVKGADLRRLRQEAEHQRDKADRYSDDLENG